MTREEWWEIYGKDWAGFDRTISSVESAITAIRFATPTFKEEIDWLRQELLNLETDLRQFVWDALRDYPVEEGQ